MNVPGKLVRTIIVVFFTIISIPSSLANLDEKINNHVIISFDDALPFNFSSLLIDGESVRQAIKKILVANNILNDSRDYYSILNFACGRDITNFKKDFVAPSDTIAWIPFKSYEDMFNHGNWARLVYEQGATRAAGQGYGPCSLLTGAKQYSLVAVSDRNKGNFANRTYLLMITDDWYAGMDDYQKEFEDVFASYAEDRRPAFLKYFDGVNALYKFKEIGRELIASGYNKNYEAILYEVLPLSTFSLGSVVDYPANLGLKRVKGGYKVDFAINTVDKGYKIEKMALQLKNVNDELIAEIDADENERIFTDVLGSELFPGDSVNVALLGWFRQLDEVYGGLIMNPYDPYYSRLKVEYRLPLEQTATIFGKPLIDDIWWWYPDDAAMAALIWEAIIVLVLMIVFALLIRRILIWRSVYKPSDKELKLKRID